MYFVDRETIEQTLVYLENKVTLLNSNPSWETPLDQLALERSIQMVIESILDVGNSMIDGFIMRDPGSYEDIIDILEDEKVIQDNMAAPLKKVIELRKPLVQHYLTIDHQRLEEIIQEAMPAVIKFPGSVRKYLLDELGPVSAFRK
ncbi:type VII toxin-antitoxin system HepT family RNase toxin [Jeotgalibacillus proteolyticus]|uniref:DUF86 domain-containing protein n=1 Tax=Jeotgalibacillus proteolyticus TaxID=2082395 RepID=A0A2S5GAU0_9BACL|nr:DUF86 domain-containing protein [Jeotgalibacillus proteolyticus]PPA70088.1 DUF86 domain-containing protein [Jeotgalibacillus proteolyticus]